MKKAVVGLALLGAAGYVMAQSSVTLYGVADAGIGQSKLAGEKGIQMQSGGSLMDNGTSRIGLRGEEDLGSGLKAGFVLESGLSLKNGSATDPDGFWGRDANVYVSGAFGKVQLGRDWTPADYALSEWELTGLANYNMVENMFTDVGTPYSYSSGFQYTTPVFGGFHAMGTFVTHADNFGHPKFDIAGFYENGPLSAAVDVNKVKTKKANWSIGAKYQVLNWLTVASSYNDVRSFDFGDGTYAGKRRGMTLGASGNWGLWTLTVDLGQDFRRATMNAWGTPKEIKKYTNGLVETKYALSKQTFVYGAYLRIDGTNNFGLGVRHNF